MSATLLLGLVALLGSTAGQDGLVCSPQKTFPHPDDCSRYYYCDNTNTPQVFYCSPGVHFNPETEQCDLPDSAPCPYVPIAEQPSDSTLLGDSQPSDSSPVADEGLVVGQSYASLPNTRQFYTPDLEQPSVPSLLENGQSSDPYSSPVDEVVGGQSSAPSLPNFRQFYTPDFDQSSVHSLLDLEQSSVSSSPEGEAVVVDQSYVPVFPGRGGPVFQQPEGEDRKDDVTDIIYEIKSENTSESFGTFFSALNNFEKTLEEGRQKEEGGITSDFVDVKRQAPADDGNVSSVVNFADQPVVVFGKEEGNEPIVVYAKEEGNTEVAQSEGTPESVKTEGRCSADSDFFARKAPTDTGDITFTSEKTEESTTSGVIEPKTGSERINSENKNTDLIVWPLFPLSNLTGNESDTDASRTLDYPTVKSIEFEPQNLTDEAKPTFNYPTFTILNLNESTPLQHTETGQIEIFEGKKEANEDKIPERAEDVEEAKGTIIFESHSAEEEKEKDEVPEEGMAKVVIKETAIL